MKKVIIDRAKWRTGRYPDPSRTWGWSKLLNGQGHRCCLGFLGAACGITDDLMFDCDLPSATPPNRAWPDVLFVKQDARKRQGPPGEWEDIFAGLNDVSDIDDATRESWIASGFAIVLGVEVEFIGQYPELP